MTYDFETLINRSHSGSAKWMGMKEINSDVPDDVAPLSVADVDMKLAPEIQEGLINFLKNNPVLGYTQPTDDYFDAVINWFKNKYQFDIERDWIVLSNGIVPALFDCVAAYTHETDGIIVFTPVYYPFYNAIRLNKRQVVECPLTYKNKTYQIDFDMFERLAKDQNNTMLILCSPHNPVGRVWKKEELERIAQICLENHITIISDEIHQDLTMPGYTHYSIASLNKDVADITVTCTAPSKSFNIAGLQGSNIIIKNEELRKKLKDQQESHGMFTLNTFSFEATKLAYTKGEAWLEEFKQHIYHNYQVLCDFVDNNLQKADVCRLEGTYLVWVDLRKYGYDYEELEKRMQSKHVYLDEGYVFGEQGKGFERFNIACPTQVLIDVLNRVKTAL